MTKSHDSRAGFEVDYNSSPYEPEGPAPMSTSYEIFDIQDFDIQDDEEGGDLLTEAAGLLAQSTAGGTMLREALSRGWDLLLDDLGPADFDLDAQEMCIILNNQGMSDYALSRSPYFKNQILTALIRALREVWQESRYGGTSSEYAPDAILTHERVRAADLDVTLVLVAWELRVAEQGALWRFLIGAEEGDIAMRFMGYLERDLSLDETRDALAAAFTQWFRSEERVNACDHDTLDYLDAVMEEVCNVNAFGRKQLTPIAVERLSCLPDRSAYLMGRGGDILTDPLYAGMNDEINQAHLMHILRDLDITYIENVPFRDAKLAAKIFPDEVVEE